MADHYHSCPRCSCRWDCDAKQCCVTGSGWCPWCLAAKAASDGKPQITHDHEWAGGENCGICKVYEEVSIQRKGAGK